MELYEYWHVTWRSGRASPYIRAHDHGVELIKQAEEVEIRQKVFEAKNMVNEKRIDSLDTQIHPAQDLASVSSYQVADTSPSLLVSQNANPPQTVQQTHRQTSHQIVARKPPENSQWPILGEVVLGWWFLHYSKWLYMSIESIWLYKTFWP